MKKRHILRYMVLGGCIAASGIVLMQISQHVQRAEDRQALIQREIMLEKQRIAVLEAEWAYLNAPQRLETIAHSLGMQRPGAGDLIEDAAHLPEFRQEYPASNVFIAPQPASYPVRKPERLR